MKSPGQAACCASPARASAPSWRCWRCAHPLDTFGELEFKEGIASALNLLGVVEQGTGNPRAARSLLERSLTVHRELGDRWREASVLEALAHSTGQRELLAEAAAIRARIGAPVPAVERDMARSG